MTDQQTDWKQKLPENIRGTKLVADAQTEENFWKRIEDQQRFLGTSIRIPSNEASPEQWKEFSDKIRTKVPGLLELPKNDDDAAYGAVFEKLGKPDKPEKYNVDSLKDTLKLTDADVAALREAAHHSDLTQRQFLKMVKRVNDDRQAQMMGVESTRAEDQKALRAEWGAAFDERIGHIEKFLADSGAPKGVLEQVKAGAVPGEQMRWLHGMAKRMSEGAPLSGNPGEQNKGVGGKLDPLEARQRLDEIYKNKSHPYHRSGDPAYPAAVKRVMELVEMSRATG